MKLKENNGMSLIVFTIILVLLILVTIGIIMFPKEFINEEEKVNINESPQLEINNSQDKNTQINNIKSSDYEIAKILFANFFGNEFNESQISEAKYNIQDKEFSCTYIIKQYEDWWMTDKVIITTEDFISYRFSKTVYSYNEEIGGELYPTTLNSSFENLSNEEKNKIITIANLNGYYVSKNLSDQEFLEIIFLNDKTNIKEIISNGKYILKNYYISNGQIYFEYIQENNEANYLKIFSWQDYSTGWNIDGRNEKNIYGSNEEVYEYKSMIDGKTYYCIDYDLKIEKNIDEMKAICSKLGFE